jgi:hypothetical protein
MNPMPRCHITIVLSGWLGIAPLCVADDWIAEYTAVAPQAVAACDANRLKECRDGVQRLADLTDGRPDFRCRLARAQVELGELQPAMSNLAVCVRSGLEFKDLATDRALDALRPLAGYAELQQEQRRHAVPAVGYREALSLGDADLVSEDIVADAGDGAFLVSSVRKRKIIRVARDGSLSDFMTAAQLSSWGVYALALDPAKGILWATASAGPESPPVLDAERGRSVLLKINVRTRQVLARLEVAGAGPHGFGDMTLGPRGEPYVSDGLGGGVYTVDTTPLAHLRAVVAPGSIRSPQTPAYISGSSRLLVPDYSRGIAVINLAVGGAVTWLPHPAELALFGIDGLYLEGRTLVAIQNGTRPERVLVMTLDPTCTRIADWRVAVARPATLGDPTHGVIVGKDFYFLANSGWDRIADDGQLTSGADAKPPAIWKLDWTADAASRAQACSSAASSPAG